MKRILKLTFFFSLSIIFISCIILAWMMRPLEEHEISGIGETGYLIAHACGSIDGKCYTNSKEALLASLDKGCGYIEVDLYLTPVIIWVSDKYKKANEKVVTDLYKAKDKPMMIDNLCHLLMRVGGGIM